MAEVIYNNWDMAAARGTTARKNDSIYILRLLLDQSKPLLLYEFSQVAAYADNPFMKRQYQPVPMQYVGWFRHEIRSIYEQLRTAGVPVREMITVQQRVISW